MSSYENALQAFRWLHAAQHLPMESDLRKIRHYTPQEVDRGGGAGGGRKGGRRRCVKSHDESDTMHLSNPET